MSPEPVRTYNEGLRDGKIEALEHIIGVHADRLNQHSNRIRWLERIIWSLAGVIFFLQMLPYFQQFLSRSLH